jgi:hypothetical protein
MSKGDFLDVQKQYDAVASWLRDCCRKGDSEGVTKAQNRAEELDIQLAFDFKEDGEQA